MASHKPGGQKALSSRSVKQKPLIVTCSSVERDYPAGCQDFNRPPGYHLRGEKMRMQQSNSPGVFSRRNSRIAAHRFIDRSAR